MPTTTDSPRPFRDSGVAYQGPSAKLAYPSIPPYSVHRIRCTVLGAPTSPRSRSDLRAAVRADWQRSAAVTIGLVDG